MGTVAWMERRVVEDVGEEEGEEEDVVGEL
jgi:hypothetical protein